MIPLHGELGKFYYSVECINSSCKNVLYIAEVTPDYSRKGVESLYGQSVRCSMCTQESVIEERRIIGIR